MNVPNVLDHDSDSKVPVVLRGNVSLKGEVPSGTFSHELGIIRFTLHDVPAYAAGFVLKSESEALAGLFQDGGYVPSHSSNAIKFSFPYKTGYNYSTENDGDADPDDAVIYVALPAGTYSGLSVYFIDGDGDIIEGTQKKMKPAALAAGDYVIMPVLDLKKSQLRKDYVKVIGVKWAKGNLVRDAENSWHSVQEGVDDGFQTGWGLHDEQWKYINWDGSLNQSGYTDRYTQNNNSYFDVFSWGGIGRQASYRSGRLVPSTSNYDISCKVFWGYLNTNLEKCRPENLEQLEGDACFSSELASNGNSQYTKDGKAAAIAGDVAYWASKGKYCMPKKGLLSSLSHNKTSKASFQYGKYVKGDVIVYGYLYTTPLGDIVRSNEEVTFTDADLESGLFLPFTGRRSNRENGVIINQRSQAIYRSSTFGDPSNATHPQCATSLWFEGAALPQYGYTHGKGTEDDGYSSICTLSNAAGGCIRPVLVDGPESVLGDVAPLPVSSFDVKVGEPLPAWSEGCLDIHAINSGRGECTFFVLPDGTSLCVDAGEIAPAGGDHPRVDAKPDVATRAYKVYSEYIKAYLPKGDTSMDYMLMTHFHNDHFGTTNAQEDYPMDSRDGYKYPLTGIMALYDEVPFDKIIDRAFDENSDYVTDVPATGQDYSDGYGYYGQFVTWARAKKGLVVEKAVNGSDSQLALVNKPSGYPDFKIQINAVNGWYWNGSKSVDAYSLNRLLGKQPAENGNSISFLLSYGDFDYLTSGDAGANTRIENNLAKSINRKIEAMKAHHHFAWETMSATSMAIYQPTVVVSQSFYDHQPDMGHQWLCDDVDYTGTSTQAFQTAWNAYSGEKHWFFTNIHPTTASVYPYEVAKMAGMNGHVVIRVAKNAEFYYVYMLDDTDMNYNVKSIHGPFTCHK
jgi:beta-lactamase superfamily II metal-dependent hydrolase